MALSPQSQAVASLNELNSLAVLLNQFLVRATSLSFLPNPTTIWQALPTCALNADGSLGTPDTDPQNANPINTALVPGLTRAASYTQYDALLTLINGLVSSSATPTNIDILSPFLGG